MRAPSWSLVLLAAACVAGCGSNAAATGTSTGSGLQGLIISPRKPAPPLILRNYTGAPVDLRSFRGKAVLVTFVYTRCPDVCPLIVSSLAAAQRQLGREASRVQIVAVTVDPRNDTPRAIKAFLAERGATGRIDYLIGSRKRLLATWKAWGVGVTFSRSGIPEGHTALVFGITPAGSLAVVYPANVSPAELVHDVPLLARS